MNPHSHYEEKRERKIKGKQSKTKRDGSKRRDKADTAALQVVGTVCHMNVTALLEEIGNFQKNNGN